jgi:exodeoxyribonuclease VII large subunit
MKLSPPLATDTRTTAAPKALTVGEVVGRIRSLIKQAFPAPVWVEGQVSNCTYHSSGHIYFSLVDEQATDRLGQRLVLPCAFFRAANAQLKFRLEDGLKVLCLGEIATYEARGQYQLIVLRVEPKGQGALQLAFEQLKKRLGAEGLFDPARKRPIPRLPQRVGIVTSLTGSAIHDMVARLRGLVHIVVVPVKVQGEGAAAEIAEGIRLANAQRLAEVLIVGRGGGSLEDLWAFNEEVVARAIFTSRIPIVSAVGHEDHWTIADYVADVRASTPTHAAQLLAQEQQAFLDRTQELVEGLTEGMRGFLETQESRVEGLVHRLRLLHPLHVLRDYGRRAIESQQRLIQLMRHRLDQEERTLHALGGRLNALSPLAVLGRGYSITFRLPSRAVATDAKTLHVGDEIETLLAKGRLTSRVTDTALATLETDADA